MNELLDKQQIKLVSVSGVVFGMLFLKVFFSIISYSDHVRDNLVYTFARAYQMHGI